MTLGDGVQQCGDGVVELRQARLFDGKVPAPVQHHEFGGCVDAAEELQAQFGWRPSVVGRVGEQNGRRPKCFGCGVLEREVAAEESEWHPNR